MILEAVRPAATNVSFADTDLSGFKLVLGVLFRL